LFTYIIKKNPCFIEELNDKYFNKWKYIKIISYIWYIETNKLYPIFKKIINIKFLQFDSLREREIIKIIQLVFDENEDLS
jgi:hypothetical protein